MVLRFEDRLSRLAYPDNNYNVMKIVQNIVKGWITTTIGTGTIITALLLVVKGSMPLFWEGSFLFFIGGVFLIVPDKFAGIVDAVIKKKTE